jgi:acetyltransferase-like isoleucine patch superfamily enzyme
MINYEPFMPYDSVLVTERDHCKKQLFQFNSGDNPRQHVTLAERQRVFRAVVEAKRMTRPDLEPHYRGAEPFVPGHVGQHVYVDIPFHCDYGYHLVIGDMVTIGPNCHFMDSGKITIGRKTRICANVTIDTQRTPKDSKSDKGSGGSVVAAEVVIGENCYIGPNVTIMGPVRIGTGAIIHAGSVITRVRFFATDIVCAYQLTDI